MRTNSFAFLLAMLTCACAPTLREGLLINDATIISADAGAPYRADVHIVDGLIAALAPELRAAPGVEVLDARGLFLTPGLIDSHVHIGHPIGLSDEQIEQHPELYGQYLEQLPRSYLFFGFTTLIDLDLSERNRARFESAPVRPRLLGCGRGIRQPGGYGPTLFPADVRYRIFPEFVWDERFAGELPTGADPAEHTPEAVVRRIAEGGAVCIKTYAEPGFGGVFDWPMPSQETLVALRRAAHAHGLPLVVHATDVNGWRVGIDADADVIAHGLWHWEGDRLSAELPAEARGVLAAAAGAGVQMQPTMQVLHGERSTYTWDLTDDPRLAQALPPAFLDWMRSDEAQWSRRDLRDLYDRVAPRIGHPDTPPIALLDAADARVAASTRVFVEDGGTLLFGSDTPAQEGIGNPPGLNGLMEIERWSAAGIPPEIIFAALTARNAEAFNLDDVGRIAEGMRADLLLMAENPMHSATAYDTIAFVIVAGEPLPRSALSAAR